MKSSFLIFPTHSIDSWTVKRIECLWHICKMYYPHGRDEPGSREPNVGAVFKVTPPFDFQYFILSTTSVVPLQLQEIVLLMKGSWRR